MTTLAKLVSARRRVLLVGPPGCGKTARVGAAAREAGFGFEHVPLHHTERVDWGGCFVPDSAAGVTRQLPLERLHRWVNSSAPVLVLIDDLGKAPIDVQGALKSVITRGSNTLPPKLVIWGATNRPQDKAGVSGLDESLRSEFDVAFSIPVPGFADKADGSVGLGSWADEVTRWCDWAMANGADPFVVAWHRSPQFGAVYPVGPVLYGWKPSADPSLRFPDYRSWESVLRLRAEGIDDLDTTAAAVGQGQAAAFLAFVRMAAKLPAVEQVWLDPHGAPVPADPGAQVFVATRLGGAVTDKLVTPFVEYINRLPGPISCLAARDAYRRLGAAFTGAKAGYDWFVAHKEIFEV